MAKLGRPLKYHVHITISLPKQLWKDVLAKLKKEGDGQVRLGKQSELVISLLTRWLDGNNN